MRTPLAVPLVVAGVFGALASVSAVSDTDFFWHLSNGDETIRHGLARVDLFSWTIPGGPVLLDQWLGDVVMAGAYALGSWRGVIAVRAVAVAAIVGLTLFSALAASRQRPLAAVVGSLPGIALSRFIWTDRPELLGFVAFAALLVLLRDGRTRALWIAVPLLALWANLHGSYALGLGLLILVCAERAFTEAGRRRELALIGLAALGATLLTPSGLLTWTSSGGHFLAPPRYIQEETPPDLHSFPGMVFAANLGLLLIAALLGRRLGAREAVILVPIAFVSLTAARHTPFLGIASAPFLASWVADAGDTVRRVFPAMLVSRATRTPGRRSDAAAAVAALGIIAGAIAFSPPEPDERAFPVAALAALPDGPGLLNAYDWGGWLTWRAKTSPVFVDGRLFPYVPEVLDDYRAIVGLRSSWRDVIARRDVRTLLLRPTDAAVVRAKEVGWRVLSASDDYVLLERP